MNNIATYEAIAEVFLKNKHRLYYIAYSYVSSAYIVEEIVADTLLAVLEKAPIFTSEKQCLCYIKQAVRNRAISYLTPPVWTGARPFPRSFLRAFGRAFLSKSASKVGFDGQTANRTLKTS